MKDVRTILYNLSAEQGWDGATMLELCLSYIEAQESNEAFEDFLAQQAKIESGYRGELFYLRLSRLGGNDETVSVLW